MSQEEDFRFHDTVLVKGLRVEASVGVFDWEKQIKQTLVFDAELYADFSAAAQSDAIEDAVDYSTVCAEITALVSQKHYQLLEYLAEEVCKHLLIKFPVGALSLAIYKPGAVANTDYVGIKVFRAKAIPADHQQSNCTEQNGRC